MQFSSTFQITGKVSIDTSDIRDFLIDHPGMTVGEAFSSLALDKLSEDLRVGRATMFDDEQIEIGKMETDKSSTILPSDTQLPCKECDGEPGKCECLDCGIAIVETEADYDHYCGACSYKNARL